MAMSVGSSCDYNMTLTLFKELLAGLISISFSSLMSTKYFFGALNLSLLNMY